MSWKPTHIFGKDMVQCLNCKGAFPTEMEHDCAAVVAKRKAKADKRWSRRLILTKTVKKSLDEAAKALVLSRKTKNLTRSIVAALKSTTKAKSKVRRSAEKKALATVTKSLAAVLRTLDKSNRANEKSLAVLRRRFHLSK